MRRKEPYLHVAAFAGGLVSLAVELAASSLLRNHFGTANLVWATVIGLILLYLTAGYFLGGRWGSMRGASRQGIRTLGSCAGTWKD